MVVNFREVPRAIYDKSFIQGNYVMNRNNYYKQVYSIVSHYNLNKFIRSTCIAKYINADML